MIRVDSRVGSSELGPLFQPYGIVPEETKLDFGDFDFTGQGPRGICSVVFERKRIEDLLDSMKSDRLSGYQLPGIASTYDYGYLLVEGIWTTNQDGFLQVRNRWGKWTEHQIQVRGVNNFIMGLALRAGMIPWRTSDQKETVGFIVDQYRMWEKPWTSHSSHDTVYAPAAVNGFGLNLRRREVSVCEKVAMQLPGLDSKARYVAKHFGTVSKMCVADAHEWARVSWKTSSGKDRTIGQVTAEKVVKALRG